MITEVARNYLNELERDLDWLRSNVQPDHDGKRRVAAHVEVSSETGDLDHIGNGEQCEHLNVSHFLYEVAWIEIDPDDFNESAIVESLVTAFEDAYDRSVVGEDDALGKKLDWDARMRAQADNLRVTLARSTQENPVTLSRELYDRLPPHHRIRFKRA